MHDTKKNIVFEPAFNRYNNIIHGFTTRQGGVSQGIYESMNMGFYIGDQYENVLENYKRFSSQLGIDYKRISCPNQLHNSNILIATEKDAGDGITRELSHKDVDGQITNVPNLPLIVYFADCVPIFFNDPHKNVIGTAHAGWRGSVAGIAAKIIKKMETIYSCNPKDINVLIGPSISKENYEVDNNVIDQVKNCPFIDEEDFEQIFSPINDKYLLDLWNLNTIILSKVGVLKENIFNTKLCTMKNHDLFFSHRYTKGKRGLNAGIIQLSTNK